MEFIFLLPSASIATRQAARCCSDTANVVGAGVVVAGVVATGVVTTGVVVAGVVVADVVVTSVKAAVDGVGGISSFVEGDGLPEVTVVTSVAPVVVTIPESEVTIPPVESSTGDWSVNCSKLHLKPPHGVCAVTVVVVVVVTVVVGPAVTGAAAVVEH